MSASRSFWPFQTLAPKVLYSSDTVCSGSATASSRNASASSERSWPAGAGGLSCAPLGMVVAAAGAGSVVGRLAAARDIT